MWKREGAPASSRPFSSVIKGPEAKAEKERGLALVHALSLSIRCCSVFAPYAEIWMWDGEGSWSWRRKRRQPACREDILLCQGLVQPYSVSFEGERERARGVVSQNPNAYTTVFPNIFPLKANIIPTNKITGILAFF